MTKPAPAGGEGNPAFRRLGSIARLDEAAFAALSEAARQSHTIKPNRELLREGAPVAETLLMLSGWAARIRQLEDGRRQIMSFFLPGDLVGDCRHAEPLATSTVSALTVVVVCAAPPAQRSGALEQAYAVSRALEEVYLLAQITRLGRLNAEERVADLLLELLERLSLCGLVSSNQFLFPLTQEILADATGLSCVHINRTLQQLRRQGDITLKSGFLTLNNPSQLAHRVGRAATRVTQAAPRP